MWFGMHTGVCILVPNFILINTVIITGPCYLLRTSKSAAHVNYGFRGGIS